MTLCGVSPATKISYRRGHHARAVLLWGSLFDISWAETISSLEPLLTGSNTKVSDRRKRRAWGAPFRETARIGSPRSLAVVSFSKRLFCWSYTPVSYRHMGCFKLWVVPSSTSGFSLVTPLGVGGCSVCRPREVPCADLCEETVENKYCIVTWRIQMTASEKNDASPISFLSEIRELEIPMRQAQLQLNNTYWLGVMVEVDADSRAVDDAFM